MISNQLTLFRPSRKFNCWRKRLFEEHFKLYLLEDYQFKSKTKVFKSACFMKEFILSTYHRIPKVTTIRYYRDSNEPPTVTNPPEGTIPAQKVMSIFKGC